MATIFSGDISAEEQAAQDWHNAAGHIGQDKECWCCCRMCKLINPHLAAAKQAAAEDIADRIRESMKSARAPRKDDAHYDDAGHYIDEDD